MPPTCFLPAFSPVFLMSGENEMVTKRRSQLLTTAEAAEELRLKKHTLENMRWQGTGPPFRKHGGRVFYHRADLKEWSERARRRSSSGRKE
jgi:Helix-turn-helix domain